MVLGRNLEDVVAVRFPPCGDGAFTEPSGSEVRAVGGDAVGIGSGDGLSESGSHDTDEIDGVGEGCREIERCPDVSDH